MTREEIRDRILLALNESTSSPIFYSTSEIDATVGEAMEVLAEESRSLKRSVRTALRPGKCFYATRALAPDILLPYRVTIPTLDRRLAPCTMRDLDIRHLEWRTVNGDPEYWFPVSWDQFGIWPIPTAVDGTIEVNYLAWPRALVDDDDSPEFDEADHDFLVLYGIYDGLLKQWDTTRGGAVWQFCARRWLDARARNVQRVGLDTIFRLLATAPSE